MILDFIVDLIFGIFELMLDLVPTFVPVIPSGAVVTVASGAAMANAYFPVQTLGTCLVAVMGAKFALGIWRLCVFIYDRFPGKFT